MQIGIYNPAKQTSFVQCTKAIPNSMQLIAGRAAQQFNQRKKRKGAYREDRYHATAVQSGDHLIRCMVYIDMNMVRAREVKHLSHWQASGYREIQSPPICKRIIDIERAADLCEIQNADDFQTLHRQWVEYALKENNSGREAQWSEAVAVGSKGFIGQVQQSLGILAKGRSCLATSDCYQLKEDATEYQIHSGPKTCI